MTATLVREAMEESQVLVTKAAYLGYQGVYRGEDPPFAQVRMAWLIDCFEPRAPDPDGGRLFRRFMSALDDAPAVLGWGEPAVAQAAAAGVQRQSCGGCRSRLRLRRVTRTYLAA